MSHYIYDYVISPPLSIWGYFFQPKAASFSEREIYKSNNLSVFVPEKPLAPGSLQIRAETPFSNLNNKLHKDIFRIQKAIAERWHREGKDFLFYGKIEPAGTETVFEAVPYPRCGTLLRIIKQILVIIKIRFGGYTDSAVDLKKIKETYADFQINTNIGSSDGKEKCSIFCDKKIIDKQKVFENEHLYVLLNVKQIGIKQNDLLIVPKRHIERFEDLTKKEGMAMAEIARKIYQFFNEDEFSRHKCFIFDKTGAAAGQTVAHFHRHIIIEEEATPESKTFWSILKNMVWPHRYSDKELEQKRLEIEQLFETIKS